MKTIDQLKTFYETELLSSLEVLENKRRAVLKESVIILAVGILIGVVILILFKINDAPRSLGFVAFLLIFSLAVDCCMKPIKGYVSGFKQLVIGRLVKFIDEGLTYNPKRYISKSVFIMSHMFRFEPHMYNGEDLVKGTVGKTKIGVCELDAKLEYDAAKKKTLTTIFQGLFFVGEFNKHSSCQTVVLSDSAQKLLGRLGQKFQAVKSSRGQLIKMEDPEFEKHFVVYGDDQVGARYVLSTSLMRRIVDYKNKTGKNICLSFIGSNVFIAIPYKKNLFEPRIFRTLMDFEPIQEYFEDLQTAIGIVEDLNLNRRIWTKQ